MRIVVIIVVLLFSLVALPELVISLIECLLILLFGWIKFLSSTLPTIAIKWDMVFTAIGCIAALGVGSHYFAAWLYKSIGREEPWRRSWTMTGLAATLLLFVSGISAVGATHQTTWLINSPYPLITERRMPYRQLEVPIYAAKHIAKESHDSAEAVRQALRANSAHLEQCHSLIISDSNDKFLGIVTFHRDPVQHEMYGLAAEGVLDDARLLMPMSQLAAAIDALQTTGSIKSLIKPE